MTSVSYWTTHEVTGRPPVFNGDTADSVTVVVVSFITDTLRGISGGTENITRKMKIADEVHNRQVPVIRVNAVATTCVTIALPDEHRNTGTTAISLLVVVPLKTETVE
jgi:hypothetical protein